MLDLHKKLKKGMTVPLYLLYGQETFLINETKQKIIQTALSNDELDFNLSVYDLEEVPIEQALEEAETLPFMGEKRVVIIRNPIFLTALKSKTKIDHHLADFEKYILNPVPDTILIVIANYEKLDDRKKLVKLLKKHAETLEATKFNEHSLKGWIDTRAAENKVSITEDAKVLLIETAGTDLMLLANEIDKMALYIGESGEITQEVVKGLAARTLEQNIFSLVEHVVNKQLEPALTIYYDLLQQKEEPIKILSLLASQFRLFYHVKELSGRGYGQKQIAGMLKIHPYRVKLAAQQIGTFKPGKLEALIDELADADLQMKSGQMEKKLILEMFMIKNTREKGS